MLFIWEIGAGDFNGTGEEKAEPLIFSFSTSLVICSADGL
jgi:hypothetical protein